MVRRMAMSCPLSFTSMIRPETMLSAATSTIMVRIRNITLRSTCSALKKVELRCRQSTRNTGRPAASVTALRKASILSGLVGEHLDRGHVVLAIEIGLRLRQRHEHEAGVIFRHADLEHGRHLVGLDARRHAHRRHRALGRDQRDGVAGMQRQLIGEPASDGDALPLVKSLQRALLDVLGDRGEVVEVLRAHAAHQHARGVERPTTPAPDRPPRARQAGCPRPG